MRRATPPALSTRLISVCIAAMLTLSGCTSMHRVPMMAPAGPSVPLPVKPGDQVRVTLRDGASAQFMVGAVNADALVANDGTRYERTNIVTLERRQFSGRKTALLLLGIPVGAFLLAMLAFAVEGG